MSIWPPLTGVAGPPDARRRGATLLLSLLIPALCAGPVRAGPSVAELLAVCERGSAAGNTGVDAAICEWYAVPCDCKSGRTDVDSERWCLPETESGDNAMLRVLDALRRVPDRAAAAEEVVPGIMSRLYPCNNDAGVGG